MNAAIRDQNLPDQTFHSTDDGTALKLATVTAVMCVVVMLGLAYMANLIG